MKVKDLLTLILIPIVIVVYSLYMMSEFNQMKLNSAENTIETLKIDEILSNIKATEGEEAPTE